ncbi:hypothetical protein DFP74_4591 [Nocardiopsis sp. Huas11]|uniref:hypothetical protein n=1 Tax=Nocardiopsis sp. Huas11 TaxID=2183912 RepID=UPI000EB4801D|nr:hypothetical protein [Nocardiopsis sp. Huas11]RKS08868.1 hypothetical protein DFP74_4591 [Nocardiopsis sp. Huas11]
MSPKKRQRRKAAPQRPRTTDHDQAAPTGPDQATARPRTERTPLVLPDPPDKRLTALWVALTVLWALGTPLALANLLFAALDMQEAALTTGADPTAPAPDISSVGNALIWVLVLALVVPAASAVAAAILRRKIAAIGFTAALVVSAVPLFWVMPPPDLWDALRAHLSG